MVQEGYGAASWKDQRLNAFTSEPVMEWLRDHGMASGYAIWLVTPFLALVTVGASAAQGTLWLPDARHYWTLDTSKILFRNRYELSDYGGEEPSLLFPLARDYPTILLYVIVSLWLYILFRQWTYMERFVPELTASGCLKPRQGRESEFVEVIQTANRRLAFVRRTGSGQLFVAIFFAAFVVLAHNQAGIFGVLAPTDADSDWASRAYSGWWASTSNPLGFLVYLAVALVVMYYVIKQNVVGWIVVLGLRRLNACSEVSASVVNADGWNGWLIFRKTMITVVASMAIVGSTLLVLMMVVSLKQFYWLVAFLIVFFVMSPIFILPVLLAFRRRIRDFKAKEVARIVSVPEILSAESEPHESVANSLVGRSLLVERYRSVREVPFRWPGAIAGFSAYCAQLLLALGAWIDIR